MKTAKEQVIEAIETHPNPEFTVREICNELPHIKFGTVSGAIGTLLTEGVIRRIDAGARRGKKAYYELNKPIYKKESSMNAVSKSQLADAVELMFKNLTEKNATLETECAALRSQIKNGNVMLENKLKSYEKKNAELRDEIVLLKRKISTDIIDSHKHVTLPFEFLSQKNA